MENAIGRLIRLTRVTVPEHDRRDPRTGRIQRVSTYSYERTGTLASWKDVVAKYPSYGRYGVNSAVSELAYDGEPLADHPTQFSEATVDTRNVRFQRYGTGDSRVAHLSEGGDIPPVLLVERSGELFTADGHHRLTVAELAKQPVRALIVHSTRTAPYQGLVAIGKVKARAARRP